MSLNGAARAANDLDLQKRVTAATYAEATGNATLKDTQFAIAVRQGIANMTAVYWGVANAVNAEYDAGIANGRGSPGYDTDVITDGAITAAVVANWPPDTVPPTGTGV